MPDQPSVFISYARKDARDLALRLRQDLTAAGYTAWLDTAEIGTGASWSNEIERAIDGCQVALALLSDGSFVSEICRAEQIMCLDKGKRVFPLLVQPAAPRPLHLYAKNYLDFSEHAAYDERFRKLLDSLSKSDGEWQAAPSKSRIIPNSAPALPTNYVIRSQELERLRGTVIGDDSDRQIAVTALRGMGGIGKSVLAAALCYDPVVQAAFPDGIAWVTIGRTPSNMVELMRALGEALGDQGAYYNSEQAAISRLRTFLAAKSALVVLDDVWDAKHVEPFRVAAPRCRTLITTRSGKIALAVGASEVRLDPMQPEQAVELLREWAERDDSTLPAIAKRLGYLPLALKLAGARLREGMGGQEWLETFQHVSQIKLDMDSEDPNENLQVCFELSVNQLKENNRLLYYTFGIFPEDEWIPQAVVTKLWRQVKPQMSAFDADELVNHLWRLALVERDAERKTVTLHDLLHDYTAEQLGDQTQPTHAALLATYNPLPEKPWHEVADDYLYGHVVYHLRGAGRDFSLDDLFANDEWLKGRFQQSGYTYTGYIADLMMAWKDVAYVEALHQIEANEEPTALARCVRYALIRTSINSLASNYVPELIARAVETELWAVERALSLAMNIPDPEKQAKLYALLLKTTKLDNSQRAKAQREGIVAALEIEDPWMRAEALGTLSPYLTDKDKQEALEQGLATALAMWNELQQVYALSVLAPHLRGELLEKGLAAVLAIQNEARRGYVLGALAPQLEGVLLEKALTAARAIKNQEIQAEVLGALAQRLEGEEKQQTLRKALEIASTIEDQQARAKQLGMLAQRLEGEEKQQTLRKALEIASTIEDRQAQAKLLGIQASQMEGEEKQAVLKKAVNAAFMIGDEWQQTKSLIDLIPQLEGKERNVILSQALVGTLEGENSWMLAESLGRLAPLLEGELLERGLLVALTIEDSLQQAMALSVLALQMEDELKQPVLRSALISAKRVEDKPARLALVGMLASQMEGEEKQGILRDTLEMALTIEDKQAQAQTLEALIEQAEGEQKQNILEKGLAVAVAVEDNALRGTLLGIFAPHLDGARKHHVLEEALKAGAAVEDDQERAEVLGALAPQLEGAEKHQALEHGLASALAINDKWQQGRALGELASHLTGEQKRETLEKALTAVSGIEVEEERAYALKTLGIYLEGKLLEKALASVLMIENEHLRAEALTGLAPQLEGILLEKGLKAALAIKHSWDQALLLVALAPRLEGELQKKGLAGALAIEDEGSRAYALVALVAHARGKLREQGLSAALAIKNDEAREYALIAFLASGVDELIIKEIRFTLARYLLKMQTRTRSQLLQTCADEKLFPLKVIGPMTVTAVALHIMEICNEWRWQ